MRCWRRSTTSSVSLTVLLLSSAGWAAAPDHASDLASAAIVEAVQARLGEGAEVRLESLQLQVASEPTARVSAMPDPAGRLGRSMRFVLYEPGTTTPRARRSRIGYAEAIVRVSQEYVTVARRVPGGTVLSEQDIVVLTGDVGDGRIERLPRSSEAIGARTRRALEPGVPIVAGALTIQPLVKSGDQVVTVARIGAIEARGRAVAAQRGEFGDVIRLVNRESGRRLRGRVVARGQVEVMHEP